MYTERFTAITETATLGQITSAESWYQEANDFGHHLTTLGDLTFDQACVIIATYSIRQRWAKNVDLATRFAEGERDLPTLGALNRIAENAIRFDDPYTALNGNKTWSFAHNIAGDLDAVTLDVWMLRSAGLDHKKTPGKKLYLELAESVRNAALLFDLGSLKPAQYQALVWIITRGAAK